MLLYVVDILYLLINYYVFVEGCIGMNVLMNVVVVVVVAGADHDH